MPKTHHPSILKHALVAFLALMCMPAALGGERSSSKLGQISLPEITRNHELRPLDLPDGHFAALVFITNDCPICNAYAPEIQRIADYCKSKSVHFYLVYTDAMLSSAKIVKHMRDFSLNAPALLDAKHRLVHACGATINPECALVSSKGDILYRGRIDDRYIDFGKARYRATTRDFRDAIMRAVERRPISKPRTHAVGCYIAPPL